MNLSPGEILVLVVIAKSNNGLIRLAEIAAWAGYSYNQAQRHARKLEQKQAIRRKRDRRGFAYSYEVLCSF